MRALRAVMIILLSIVCGWLVMQFEILGGRMLQPEFGSDIYTWGSVIGVFLLSLSVGYLLGGWTSRSRASELLLGAGIALAGIWIYKIPEMLIPVCDWLWDLDRGDKWGALLAALILFALPIALLSFVSPTAVRWLTKEARQSGMITGVVFAFSTIASFLGCIITAFYIIEYSISRTLKVSGGILVLTGVILIVRWSVAAWIRRRRGETT